jgi:hypothetical protein
VLLVGSGLPQELRTLPLFMGSSPHADAGAAAGIVRCVTKARDAAAFVPDRRVMDDIAAAMRSRPFVPDSFYQRRAQKARKMGPRPGANDHAMPLEATTSRWPSG